mmetsp:Transcript_30914/g.60346  ORF Transcript_30914/g.60346 Transcript_30914/m.60346 type:complete len:120 (-) Transcript_30914:846-1205(-)
MADGCTSNCGGKNFVTDIKAVAIFLGTAPMEVTYTLCRLVQTPQKSSKLVYHLHGCSSKKDCHCLYGRGEKLEISTIKDEHQTGFGIPFCPMRIAIASMVSTDSVAASSGALFVSTENK